MLYYIILYYIIFYFIILCCNNNNSNNNYIYREVCIVTQKKMETETSHYFSSHIPFDPPNIWGKTAFLWVLTEGLGL